MRARNTLVEVSSVLGGHRRELVILGGLLACAFCLASLIGYHPLDRTLWSDGLGPVNNPCGPLGAIVADLLFRFLGVGAWLTFAGIVLCFLALARKPAWGAWRVVAGAGFVVGSLAMLELAGVSRDVTSRGGMVGEVVGGSFVTLVGSLGAWVLLVGVCVLCATAVFRLPIGRVASATVGAGERAMSWSMKRALAALFRPVTDAGTAAWSTVADSIGRMRRSFVRREEEEEDAWGASSELESLDGDPDGFAPASYVDTTQVSGPSALAEVRYDPTEDSTHTEEPTDDVLGLFPVLSPRRSAPKQRRRPIRRLRRVRDLPTSPSESPVTVPTPPPRSEGPSPTRTTERIPSIPPMPSPAAATPDSFAAPVPVPPEPVALIGRDMTPVAPPARTHEPGPPRLDEALPPMDPELPVPISQRPTQPREITVRHSHDDVVPEGIGAMVPQQPAFRLPTLSLLDTVPSQHADFDRDKLQDLARRVEEILASFKVQGKVTDVRVGPVVTTFEFLPDRGISVRKVASLDDDLAMGLRALSVRIVAPIPGKGVVGIEIPSEFRLTVYLREMLASDAFRQSTLTLPIVLGKNVEGAPMVGDLATMPHLLVGGTTGSGKSVGVNAMLMSLLFRFNPQQLRLLLIDPKRLEFKIYEDIPHLLHPVVTEPRQAAAALSWACREMDSRYQLLARWDCRNIEGYNNKVEVELRNWTREKAERYAPEDWPSGQPLPTPERLPYIVVVIDELADLMLVAKKDVESSIARLTQMARACGIHLIVATQRPSVDVVTGLIKSNLPTRISFKLRSGTDSRTILDSTGAESLLGRGDMLYLPNAGDLARVHGAFASDDETLRVMDFLREQGEPRFVEGVVDEGSEELDDEESEVDQLYGQAVDLCVSLGKASTSMIQRHLKIGYNRAARIVDQMEARGVVGPADGARPREVLVGGSGH
ncbi:MAG: DNA translocase FtsK 4TM domain-containing protein [Myxococcales bacterium]|nr:DNA translocase FtsK 4TM domain-containing protein [Myxococcales bacterium]